MLKMFLFTKKNNLNHESESSNKKSKADSILKYAMKEDIVTKPELLSEREWFSNGWKP